MRALALALVLVACGGSSPAPAEVTEPAADPYIVELEAAWSEREARLVSESGWLTLVALTWLDEGESTLGSAADAHVLLPEWSAPAALGTLVREGSAVTLTPAEGAALAIDDEPLTGPVALKHDGEEGGPTKVTREGLTFYVIERQSKIGVRAKDSRHPARASFDGIPRFAASAEHKVEARLVPYDAPRKVPFPTAIGTTDEATVPGELHFAFGNEEHVLLPFQDTPDDPLFLVFADKTSGVETYGGGRFLGADPPADGVVTLDFNLAENPPCAFTPFATCPLPPKDNRLAVRVEAGEKTPAGH